MRSTRLWLVLLGLSLAFILSLAPSPVRADGLAISPASGPQGTVFEIQGFGFTPGERVDFWLQYPNGNAVQVGEAIADGLGRASYELNTDASYPSGAYVALAHGESSGVNQIGFVSIGSGGGGPVVYGTASCQGQTLYVPGFIPGEPVVFLVTPPGGSPTPMAQVTADGGGVASVNLPLQPGLAPGSWVLSARGLVSGRQTSDDFTFDGMTFSGANCSISLGGGLPGITPALIPRNLVNYQGAGVYLNTDPNNLYYFGCDWKWRPMGGNVYMYILGFRPYEHVSIAYEILSFTGRIPYSSTTADQYGNAVFYVNTYSMSLGHYHWWFTSPSAQYCGHYDAAAP